MPVESPTATVRERPYCRVSFDAPCALEKQLRESLVDENLRLGHVPHEELGNHLSGTLLCLAAARTRAAVVDPGPAHCLGEIAALMEQAVQIGVDAACSASGFVARRHGLAAALRLRFGNLACAGVATCELVVQDEADKGLLPDEHQAMLLVAEQAVGQALREGATTVRVILRRSRFGPAEISVAGEGGVPVPAEVAASYRTLAVMRQLASRVGARLNVRRLDEGGLFIRCSTRWV